MDPNRPMYKWWTVIGAGLLAGGQAAEEGGLVPAGSIATTVNLLQALGAFLAISGFARKVERMASKPA